MTDNEPIMAIGSWQTNGHLIKDCHKIGYIGKLDSVLDCTYGYGAFWSEWKPKGYLFHATDADPLKSPDDPTGVDFRKQPHADESFDVVVYDPPYKMNGKPSDSSVDERYGVNSYTKWQDRWDIVFDGLRECCRISRDRVLVKVQDQVVSGKCRWITHDVISVADELGFGLEDKFEFMSYRPQPNGVRQVHSRRNYSTLLVLKRGLEWRPKK